MVVEPSAFLKNLWKPQDLPNPKKTENPGFPTTVHHWEVVFIAPPGNPAFSASLGSILFFLENGTPKLEVSSSVCQKYAKIKGIPIFGLLWVGPPISVGTHFSGGRYGNALDVF